VEASLRRKDEGVVIPFHAARSGLWTAQREWLQNSRPLQRLAAEISEELGRAEHDMAAVEAALRDPHPGPAQFGSFVRGELSREENRALVRHLLKRAARNLERSR
jgi:hypothetical protein